MQSRTVLSAVVLAVLVTTFLVMSGCGGNGGSSSVEPQGCAEECHLVPPQSGAHLAHDQSQSLGGVSIACDACHGEGAASGLQAGHRDTDVTLLGAEGYEAAHTTLPSWFGSTWGGPDWFGTPDAEETEPGVFACRNIRCHGGGSVAWDEKAGSPSFNRVCLGCHDITPSEFQLPGESRVRRAVNAAANYEGPISGFSRGGHGDTAINDPEWFRDSAPGSAVPLACVACHDAGSAHFPVSASNPYRIRQDALDNALPGANAIESRISNLCTQTGCHPKTLGGGNVAFLSEPKHPSDHWPMENPRAICVSTGAAYVNDQSAGSSTADPHYDPAGVAANGDPAVGLHIDRYQDHWGWWNSSLPATPADSDDVPFMPLGDSLSKNAGDAFDNNSTLVVTCITCHNPHGTDLAVAGKVPGQPDEQAMVPSNKMLRLRDQDDELCNACHRTSHD